MRPVRFGRYSDTLRFRRSGDRTPVEVRFFGTVQPEAEATESPVQGVPDLLPGDTEDGYATDNPPPNSAEVESRYSKPYSYRPSVQ